MQPGLQIGSYRLERVLGQGGMGSVYLARGPQGEAVALKVLHRLDPELVARFEREAKVLASISALGVVRLLEFGVHERRPYLVQEFCPGGDLAGLLRKRGRLEPDEARGLVREIAGALEVVHAAGVIHRDLKPANVLLEEGRPKVTDFGLARARGVDASSLTESGVLMGTPAYMAPEQLQDARAVDARSDVYALGVILYELLSGRRPFVGPTALAVAASVLEGRAEPLPGEVPAELREVVARAMRLAPEERFPSAESMAEALEPSGAPSRGGAALLATGLVGVGVLVGLAWVGSGGPREPTRLESPSPTVNAASSQVNASPPSPSPSSAETPNPSSAETPNPELATAAQARAFVKALELCGVAPEKAGHQLRSLRKTGFPGARAAFLRLLISNPGSSRKGRALLERAPRTEELALLRARAANSPARDATLAALEALAPRALAGEGPAREILDLAAVDAGLARDLRRLRFDLDREAPPLFRAFLGRRPAWASDWLATYRASAAFSRMRAAILAEARQIPHLGRRRFVLARLQLEHPGDKAWFDPKEDPRSLLEAAALGGYVPAAAELGRRLLEGSLEGERSEGLRWLRVAAYGGVADSSDLLIERQDSVSRELLGLGLHLRSGQAFYSRGRELYETKSEGGGRALRFMQEAAAAGVPEAHLALGGFLAEEDPQASERHFQTGLRGGGFEALRVFATSPRRTIGKETLLTGLAWAGEVEAAQEVARRLLEAGRREEARAFYRRAYAAAPAGGPARAELRRSLEGLAPPRGGPIESAGQFELLELAAEEHKGAIVELGRRADQECAGELRLQRLQAAGEAGDAASLIEAGHALRVTDRRRSLELYRRAADLGRSDALTFAGDFEALKAQAARGDPWASYAWSLHLMRGPSSTPWVEARAALGPALRAGLAQAERLALEVDVASAFARGEQLTRERLRSARKFPAVLAAAYASGHGVPQDPQKAQSLFLEAAHSGSLTTSELVTLGRVLRGAEAGRGARPGLGAVYAQPWFEAAALRGNPVGELERIPFLLLQAPHSDAWREGWRRGAKAAEELGPAAPLPFLVSLGNAAIWHARPQRTRAAELLSALRSRASPNLYWALIQLRLSLGELRQAVALFSHSEAGPDVARFDTFRRAEGALALEGEDLSGGLSALVAEETAKGRLFLVQHLLGDRVLGADHPGEPSLEDVLRPLLADPRSSGPARPVAACLERLRR